MIDPRFAEAARHVRATGLINAIERYSAFLGRPVLARDVVGYSDNEWALLAFHAQISPPSIETRRLVLDELVKRDEAVAKHNAETRARS
jgi:hypothetical protein